MEFSEIHIFKNDSKCRKKFAREKLIKLIEQKGYIITESNLIIGKYGKPKLNEVPVHFNFSYSKNYICIALSNDPIGVDIEVKFPIKESLIKKIYTDNEMNYDPFEIWVAKEAYLKFIGTGFYKKINTFEVFMENGNFRIIDKNLITKFNTKVFSKENIAFAVCFTTNEAKVIFNE